MITVRYHFLLPQLSCRLPVAIMCTHRMLHMRGTSGECWFAVATERPFGRGSDAMSADWDFPPDRILAHWGRTSDSRRA